MIGNDSSRRSSALSLAPVGTPTGNGSPSTPFAAELWDHLVTLGPVQMPASTRTKTDRLRAELAQLRCAVLITGSLMALAAEAMSIRDGAPRPWGP